MTLNNSALKNQVKLYSVDTSSFYRLEEWKHQMMIFKANRIIVKLEKSINKHRRNMAKIKRQLKKEKKKKKPSTAKIKSIQEDLHKLQKRFNPHIKKRNKHIKYLNEKIKMYKDMFKTSRLIPVEKRVLNPLSLNKNKQISIFESTLTRVSGLTTDELTLDLFVVQVYNYDIFKQLVDEGFEYNDEQYVYYSSSAGQIRTKKLVFIKKSLYDRIENTLTCEMSVEEINSKGGINPNKYQAYLALTNSASEKWNSFDIDKSIVVEDMETMVEGYFDNVDIETFDITREKMSVEIPHTDGCGIMCPSKFEKSFMYRMPWHKGLLVPFDFKEFARINEITTVKDIYGKEYFIEEIDVIFTKSQFKMWKYYADWDDYKEKFKRNNCESVMLNKEDVGGSVYLNYQMLQTLIDMTDEELSQLASRTMHDINNITKEREVMLSVLGAKSERDKKGIQRNPFQLSLSLYPELLNDEYSKEVILQKRKSLIKDAKAGKLKVSGNYTYLVPDLYAFCEFLFLGDKSPKGLLESEDVYCSLYGEEKVQVLRSPHLYKEHCIRHSIKNDELKKWFITEGIYTSVHDTISRVLQFDKSHCRLTWKHVKENSVDLQM